MDVFSSSLFAMLWLDSHSFDLAIPLYLSNFAFYSLINLCHKYFYIQQFHTVMGLTAVRRCWRNKKIKQWKLFILDIIIISRNSIGFLILSFFFLLVILNIWTVFLRGILTSCFVSSLISHSSMTFLFVSNSWNLSCYVSYFPSFLHAW